VPPNCPVCHQTVWCASGATAPSRNGRLQKLKNQSYSEEQCAQSQSRPSEAHRTLHSAYPVRHRTVRCAHRQQPLPNGCLAVEGYKYPSTTSTPTIQVSSTSHSIQELVHSLLDTIQKNQSLSKSQIHSKHLVTRESVFVRVLCALVLGSLSSSSFLFSK
jgi:hypothetical protein